MNMIDLAVTNILSESSLNYLDLWIAKEEMDPLGCDHTVLWKESKIKTQNASVVVYCSVPA